MKIETLLENLSPAMVADLVGRTVAEITDVKNLGRGHYQFQDWIRLETPQIITVEVYFNGIDVKHRLLNAVYSNVA